MAISVCGAEPSQPGRDALVPRSASLALHMWDALLNSPFLSVKLAICQVRAGVVGCHFERLLVLLQRLGMRPL